MVSALNFSDIKFVKVFGEVVKKGDYKIVEKKTRLKDVIKKSGGFSDKANPKNIEIVRVNITNGKKELEIIHTDYEKNIFLKPFDKIYVKEISNWNNEIRVTVKGNVNNPSTLTVLKGSKISSILKRVSGFSNDANVKAAYLLRKDLKEKEQELLKHQIENLQAAIISLSADTLETTTQEQKLRLLNLKSDLNELKSLMKDKESIGKLPLHLAKNISEFKDTQNDVVLKDGDIIVVPSLEQSVVVSGMVWYPTSLVYKKGESYNYYLQRAAGLKPNADSNNIFVIKQNGEAMKLDTDGKCNNCIKTTIEAGDAIVVPMKIGR